MKRIADRGSDAVPSHQTMPIWLGSRVQAGGVRSAPGARTRPIAPRVTIIEHVPAAALKQVATGQAGGRFAFDIEPAVIHPVHAAPAPFQPEPGICIVPSCSKLAKAGDLRPQAEAAIKFGSEAYWMDGSERSADVQLTQQSVIAPKPHVGRVVWRALAIGPSGPSKSRAASIPILPQSGAAAAPTRRPPNGFRELVIPHIFHLELIIDDARNSVLQAPAACELWYEERDMPAAARSHLRPAQEYSCRQAPSTDGISMAPREIQPRTALGLFPAGLSSAFPSIDPLLGTRDPFTKGVSKVLPLPGAVLTPHPAIALPTGLMIWTGAVNSYSRRKLSPPRVREGDRPIRVLELIVAKERSGKISAEIARKYS